MTAWEAIQEELLGRERYMLDPKCISVGLPIRYRCEVCGLWYMTTQAEHTSVHFCSGKCSDEYYKPTVRRFVRRFMRK